MKQALGIALTALGAVGGVAQVLNMGWQWAAPTLVAAGICTALGVLLLRRERAESTAALSALERIIGKSHSGIFDVRRVQSEAELREVSNLDAVAYGRDGIDFKALLVWWKAYPRGVWGLWLDGRCVGGIGFWPLKLGPFNELVRGRKSEADISSNTFDRSSQRAHWYIGGIFLEQRLRGSGAALTLLKTAVSEWVTGGDLAAEVEIAAIATSDKGQRLLRRFGFRVSANASESIHRHDVFVLPMTRPGSLAGRIQSIGSSAASEA